MTEADYIIAKLSNKLLKNWYYLALDGETYEWINVNTDKRSLSAAFNSGNTAPISRYETFDEWIIRIKPGDI